MRTYRQRSLEKVRLSRALERNREAREWQRAEAQSTARAMRGKVVELRCVESQSIGVVQSCEGYEMTRAGEVPFGHRFGTAKNRTGKAVMC